MTPQLFTLPNGLKIILIDTKAFPTMTMILLFGAGSRYENEDNNGIAHFLEHMVFKGSKKYPDFFTISSVLEGLGAIQNAFTSKDHTGFWVKSPTSHFEKVIDVMADIILNPLLAAREIEREKGVIVQEMNMYEDNPMRRVTEYFEQLLYQPNSLGMDVIGKKETVTKFQRQTFLDYMRKFYSPENAVLVVAGGLNLISAGPVSDSLPPVLATSDRLEKSLRAVGSPSSSTPADSLNLAQTSTYSANFISNSSNNETMKQFSNYYMPIIQQKFTRWSSLRQGFGGQAGFSKVKESQRKLEILIKYKKTEQTHFSLGYRTFSFKDARKYALSVLTTILGGGASSRLFIEVRERRGLCYYIHTGREHYHDAGYMVTQAGVNNNPETIKRAIDTILKEQEKIRKGQVKKEELTRAKEMIKGRVLLSMEDSANMASWYGVKQILEGKIETVGEVLTKIEKISGDEIIQLAKEIFRPERMNLALIGPFTREDFRGLLTDDRG